MLVAVAVVASGAATAQPSAESGASTEAEEAATDTTAADTEAAVRRAGGTVTATDDSAPGTAAAGADTATATVAGADPPPAADTASAADIGADTAAAADTAAPPTASLSDLRAHAPPVPWYQRVTSALGIFVLIAIAWLMSVDRRRFPTRIVAWGLGLQLVFALFVLKTTAGHRLFAFLNDVVVKLLSFTNDGARFVFGDYLDEKFTVALNVLPTIVFFSALMAVLYHLGVMQRAVSGIAWVMQRTMRTSGAETLSAAANIFVGQTEAPLVVKPYVSKMTVSELNSVMVGGFATVAGGVLAAYVGMLHERLPDIAGHLIAASVMSAPAALLIAKVMVPEREEPETRGAVKLGVERIDANVIDAAARGAGEGLHLALNVGAMLLAFLALVALANHLVGLPVELWNQAFDTAYAPWTLQELLGHVFYPVAFVLGVPPEDCGAIGALLGEKIVLNEFVAYVHLGEMITSGEGIGYRASVIATYALCGFANFGSIAIQLGGIGSIAPERRGDLARLGLRAMIGGTLAACMTAAFAGLLL
jgi:CNT family concentrative nucleoside transporter